MDKPKLISLSGNLEIGKAFGWDAAILFNKLEYLERQTKRKDGYCFRTAEEIEEELGIQDKRLRKIIKDLKDAGIIDVKNTYILGTTKKCRHFKILWDSDFIQFNILGKSDKSETSQRDESGTFQRDKSVSNSINSSSINNNLSTNVDKSSADATLADAHKGESVDTSSLLSTQEHTYGHSAKPQETVSILQQVIDIINPAQKITGTRLRALNARLKDYSVDEVVAAARRFAKDEWRNRPENKKFKSVDYLLAPSKFSRWAEATDEGANEKPKSKSISVKY